MTKRKTKTKTLRASNRVPSRRPLGSTASSARVTPMVPRGRTKRIILRIQHRRLRGEGFGCYFAGSARRGEARIVLDCDAMAWALAAGRGVRFRRMFIDCLAHEFIHACEDLFGLMFNERAVEQSIARVRRQVEK